LQAKIAFQILDQTNILSTTMSEFIGNRELKCNTLALTKHFKR